MTLELLLGLILFAFVSSITPGPNNIMLMSSGANYGFQKSLPHMFGVGIGFAIMVFLVGIGIVTLFDLIPASYEVLKVLSALYLLYLAYKIAKSSAPDHQASRSKPMTFVQASLFQWVNPKAWTMALTAISVYAPTRSFASVLLVAVIFAFVNIPSVSTWVVMGQSLNKILHKPRMLRAFNYTMAFFLVISLYPAFFS